MLKGTRPFFYVGDRGEGVYTGGMMMKFSTALLPLVLLAGCGGQPEEAGGLTADERQRLENIADRLDSESAEVREMLEGDPTTEPESEQLDNSTQ